jgi:hypothetical protein
MRSRMLGILAVAGAALSAQNCGPTDSVIVDLSGSVDTLVFGSRAVTTKADTTLGAPDTSIVTRFDTIFNPRDTVVIETVDTVFVATTDTVVSGTDTTFVERVDTVLTTRVDTIIALDTVVVSRVDTVVTVDTIVVVDTIYDAPILTSSASSLNIQVGETRQLTVTAQSPLGYQTVPTSVTWLSSNTGVATVSSSGIVKGITVGQASIFALAQGLAATIPTTVYQLAVPPAGSLGGGPNEPSGFTPLTERHFQAVPESGWWHVNGFTSASIIFEPSPTGDGRIGRVTFPQGVESTTFSPPTAGYTFNSQPSDVYISFYHKVSENWQTHPSSVNKVLFLVDPSGVGGGGGVPFVLNAGGFSSSVGGTYEYEGRQSHPVTGPRNFPKIATVRVAAGQWAFVEMIIRAQRSPGSSDGQFHMWVNGTKVAEVTNEQWVPFDARRTWEHVKWEPVWGGTGTSVNQTMYQYIDHFYISGR